MLPPRLASANYCVPTSTGLVDSQTHSLRLIDLGAACDSSGGSIAPGEYDAHLATPQPHATPPLWVEVADRSRSDTERK